MQARAGGLRLIIGRQGRRHIHSSGIVAQKGNDMSDIIEQWSPRTFYITSGLASAGVCGIAVSCGPVAGVLAGLPVAGFVVVGMRDLKQESHSVLRNFPVLGHMRYILEGLRPEIRQYFIEGERESVPFNRAQRTVVYQRSKGVVDSMPFGTRYDVYGEGYEWLPHSMYPSEVKAGADRKVIGAAQCSQPYDASIFNISAMSFGAISAQAVKALSGGAADGNFYHNTGEGGVSKFHIEGGGDLVYNVGTGYFGCRDNQGKFSPERFAETASLPNVKMIEIKLSQGAKPGHGGILPGSKVTAEIAQARGVNPGVECVSPPAHSAFSSPAGLVAFADQLRELSGGKPVGIKMCVGHREDVARIVKAMVSAGSGPDFITVDGGEGGTGAAPPEFSNRLGTPLVEALTLVDDLLRGAGIRERVTVISSGKVHSGFQLIRNFSLGADVCNAARAFMFSLGCIQALKCNTNRCPTGVATQDPGLQQGLVVADKRMRVTMFHHKTVENALHILEAAGLDHPGNLTRGHIMLRRSTMDACSYADLFPTPKDGSLLRGEGAALQKIWDDAGPPQAS